MFDFEVIDDHQIPKNDRRKHHLSEGCFCDPIYNEELGVWLHRPRFFVERSNELLQDLELGFGDDDEVIPVKQIEQKMHEVAVQIDNEKSANAIQEGGNHYLQMSIEPWDVIDTWPLEQRIGAYRMNVLKYTMRLGSKDERLKEARKARHYAQKLVEILEEEEKDGAIIGS